MTPPDDLEQHVERLEKRLARARAARQESERIAETALRRLYEANELKTVLLGTVNHELRTPATIIKGYADNLTEAWDSLDDGTRRQIVERISTAAEGLASMVETVLSLATLDVDNVAARIAPVDLDRIAADVVAGIEEHDVRLELDVRRVRADEQSLRRILDCLLSNATTYSPVGSEVVVTSREDDGHVELVVDDAGPGVDDETRRHVFEPFYRGPGDHVLLTSGLGVGLAVVQRLVAIHRGDVRVGESPAGGARFVVRLPLDVVAQPGDAAVVGR